jgi:two-component system, NarL family, competent response regulator ComA
MLNILLLDDHPSVLEGTKMMLERGGDMYVTVGHSGSEALDRIRESTYDVMLFDLHMPGKNGIELTKEVLSFQPEANILIYTGFDISAHINRLFEAGAVGFVLKTATREQIISAIHCAMRKEAVVPLNLLKQIRNKPEASAAPTLSEMILNSKELEILKAVAKGKSNKEIACGFNVSQRSLEYSLTELFGKLTVHSRVEAVTRAKSLGFLTDQDFI